MTFHTPLRVQADLLDIASEPITWRENGQNPAMEKLLNESFQNATRHASLYWVADEMTDVMSAAAEKLPTEPLRKTDLPEISGLVCFPRSLKPTPREDLRLDWALWTTTVMYNKDNPDPELLPYSEGGGRFGCVVYFFGWREGSSIALNFNFWMIGADKPIVETYDDAYLGKNLRAFWLLVQQPIAVARKYQNHMSRKIAKRQELPTSDVKIVRLRRPKTASLDPSRTEQLGTQVDWSHQWIVNGHWRNQYLPSISGHRLQWIAPYVKGPEDKPLVVKKTVNAWVR